MPDTTEISPALVALGWDDAWARAFREHPMRADAVPARVVAQHRDRYVVDDGDGARSAVPAGRLRHEATSLDDLPAVGDWVAVSRAAESGAVDAEPEGVGVVHAVLPRRTAFRRKTAGITTDVQVVAANVDLALLLTALPHDFNPRRLERYLTLAWESGAMPVVVLTKADLASDLAGALAEARAIAPGVDVVALSSTEGTGLDALQRILQPGRTAVLLGSSGVGKSTLANLLLGRERLKTNAVGDDGKGRHTTTHRELFRLEGGALLVDTPGMRELQLWSADSGLATTFEDVESLARDCRFADCSHASEPGCAGIAAVTEGTLDAERLESWRALQRELAWLARRQDERLAAEATAHAKSMQRALRAHLKDKRG